ncbi:MAG: YifB family Mg chelatase-like AAA ATPase [Chloroflexi bacterium]|nr:YifB family Mg chelatase-like AAA ATPase [Chloroflexota bacterium]
MTLAKVRSGAVVGVEGIPVDVEVDIGSGLPAFNIVGLPDTAVQEARERVRAAIRNAGFEFPLRRITVNLAPADVRKQGPLYDLPIAVAILVASKQVPDHFSEMALLGELSLDGHLRHVNGVLPLVSMCAEEGIATAVVPPEDVAEAQLAESIEVRALDTLSKVREEPESWLAECEPDAERPEHAAAVDLAVVRGQEHVKRALEVSAAGSHNVMLQGPPGAGKTLLARAVPGILPELSAAEALDVTKIYSVAGLVGQDRALVRQRPFRAPHHTISHAGLVGGGSTIRPGEISLAHRGVLFLDEFPEYPGAALEALREPLESGSVTISRARGSLTFPARILLIAAMNPCPCGYYGDARRVCSCNDSTVSRYQRRVSGPLLDRFDLFMDVPRVEYHELSGEPSGEPSAAVRERVEAARERQRERLAGSGHLTNAEMGPVEVREFCQLQLEADAEPLLSAAMEQIGLSARAFHRVLRVARTIADLAGWETISAAHLAEAIQYRRRAAD